MSQWPIHDQLVPATVKHQRHPHLLGIVNGDETLCELGTRRFAITLHECAQLRPSMHQIGPVNEQVFLKRHGQTLPARCR